MSKTSKEFSVAPTATAWATGWSLTRNKACPVPQPYGCTIDLGLADHLERHVVVDFDAESLRELASSLRIPGTWLKVCADPEKVIPLLHENWDVQAPQYLIAVALHDVAAVAPDGYRLSWRTSGNVTEAELRDMDGQMAARGRVAHSDGIATFDQIVTEPAHQRKGLGRVVMAMLANLSIAHEAKLAFWSPRSRAGRSTRRLGGPWFRRSLPQ